MGPTFARDRTTLEPAREETRAIANRMREEGALVGIEGANRDILEPRPPSVFSETDADHRVVALDRALDAIGFGQFAEEIVRSGAAGLFQHMA